MKESNSTVLHGPCSGSEAGSYLRLIDFVYHSTLGLRAIKKKREVVSFVSQKQVINTFAGNRFKVIDSITNKEESLRSSTLHPKPYTLHPKP